METHKEYKDELQALNALHKKEDLIIELLKNFKKPAPLVSPYYTMADVTILLKRDERTIRRWVRDGVLHPIKNKYGVFFDRFEVDNLFLFMQMQSEAGKE